MLAGFTLLTHTPDVCYQADNALCYSGGNICDNLTSYIYSKCDAGVIAMIRKEISEYQARDEAYIEAF